MKNQTHTKRYSGIDLPKFRYIPGQGPHPRHLAKGSHFPELPSPIPLSLESWQDSVHYRYAVDLFNYGYWWEAHEVLEVLWVQAKRETPTGIFLQGLIQISAALLKESQALHKASLSLTAKGLPKISTKSGLFLGLEIEPFLGEVEAFLSGQRPSPPLIVLVDV